MLSKVGLRRHEAHVTNSVLCRPDKEIDLAEAQVCCAPRLFAELGSHKAPIITLGKYAAKAVLGVNNTIKTRGFIWQVPVLDEHQQRAAERAAEKSKSAAMRLKPLRTPIAGRTVLPTIHPAFILRGSELYTPILKLDLARAARVMRGLTNRGLTKTEDDHPFTIIRSPRELQKLARKIGREVTVDIETDSANPRTARITCVGIGDTLTTIVIHPWRKVMATALSAVFRKRKVVGHNIIGFDAPVLRRHGVELRDGQIEDTMVAYHTFASHLPQALLHLASVYTDARPWKYLAKGDDRTGKGLFKEMPLGELLRYNAADVRLTALVWERLQRNLEPERGVYAADKEMLRLCASMRDKGIAFDTERAAEIRNRLRGRKNALVGDMRKLTGKKEFSPSKTADIRKAIYGRFHVPVFSRTPKGLPTTSRVVLEQLRTGDSKAARLSDAILKWRAADKVISTYLDPDIAEDGRVHEHWRMGVVSGRLACRIMTLPRYRADKHGVVDPTARVRECYVAPPGKIFVYFDLSQAEMRFAAHLSQDPAFIETCRGDVHAGNAKVLFPDAAAQGWLDGKEAKSGKGAPFRDIAKNAGFAVTYLAQWETVYAFLTSHGFPVSPNDVRAMLERLHRTYRGYFAFVDRNVAFVRQRGFLRTAQSGRIRWFGRFAPPTEIANYPIQGGIADHMNERLPRLGAKLPRSAAIIVQAHDAAIIECKRADGERVKQLVADIYGPPIVLPDRPPFEVPIDLKLGERWSDF
jgi:DNA polymerase I-like protein with 3'-5' exonuclease and polymerase domains/uracil-DNA glycosylase